MRGNYISPSELLQAQRETGKSYWDLIGQPLTPAVGYNINNPYSESEKSYKQWYNTDAKQTNQLDTKTSNDLFLKELILKYNNLLASMNKPKELKEYEYDDLPSFRKGKDKFTSFAQQLGPKIYKEMNKRGVYSDAAYDNVMRQLAMESSYGLSDVALKNHNYGGVGFNGKTYFNYKNDDAFVKDYIRMMKSKYGAALKAKNTTQYAKALKVGGYYQDSLENYTNKLNAMSSMSAAAKRHRLLNPKMYEYLVLLSDMEEPAVSTRVEKPINKEPIVNTPISTEAPLIQRPEYLESNSLIKKSFVLNMNNLLLGKEFLLSLPGFKGGKEGRKDSSFFDTVDNYANYAEKALALSSLATMGATIAAPNPITAGLALGSNIGGAVVDGYQGIRSAIKGDYANVIKNGVELAMGLVGAKAFSNASKLYKLDAALRASGAPRQYVTKTIGRRAATRHRFVETKEADAAGKASALGYGASIGGNASSFGELSTRNKRGSARKKQW